MADYISRAAALDAVCANCSDKMRRLCAAEENHCTQYKAVKATPPADVRPVIPAFWQDGNKSNKNPEGHAFNWWCSNCGTPQHTPVAKTLAEFTVDNPYCHKCGATMVRSFENG